MWRMAGLHLYRKVLEDDIGRCFLELLRRLETGDSEAGGVGILDGYVRLFSLLAAEVELGPGPLVGDPWQNHLIDRVLSDENPFSLKAERVPLEAMGASLLEATRSDLRTLRELLEIDGAAILRGVEGRLGEGAAGLVSWTRLEPLPPRSGTFPQEAVDLKQRLLAEGDWPSLLGELARYYSSRGAGMFGLYRAFRWVRVDGAGQMEGVGQPDPTLLEDLVEYDRERALLLQNTDQFVRGFRANNALLYGDRGTGKSSTVKALLHRYSHRGLRLVEVPKGLLGDFPRILGRLRGRPERFILFVDDLSFDEGEGWYRELKAVLEGGVEARPDNVVVYATSNRRHLVMERFSDRAGDDGEIRRWDTHQEKLSLADRFGITLVFATPDQERYLRIVEKLVARGGLQADVDMLRRRALEWAVQQSGFSGRTARQFVDHLMGELGVTTMGSALTPRDQSVAALLVHGRS